MQKKERANRTKKITVRFTEQEYYKIELSFKTTTKRKLSEYVRSVLLDKPVTVYARDQSLDEMMFLLSRLKNELSAIGNNFNQLVKRLHTASHFEEIRALAQSSEKSREMFLEKMGQINQKIAQLADQWSQE